MARTREEAMKRTEPTKSLLQNGPYIPADKTDIRATFLRFRTADYFPPDSDDRGGETEEEPCDE